MKRSHAYLIYPDIPCLLSVIHRLGHFFSPFLAVTRFAACLTLISGCVFMGLFAKARPEVCVVFGFLKEHNRSRDGLAQQKVSLLIQEAQMVWILLKLADQKDGYQDSCPPFHTKRMA